MPSGGWSGSKGPKKKLVSVQLFFVHGRATIVYLLKTIEDLGVQ